MRVRRVVVAPRVLRHGRRVTVRVVLVLSSARSASSLNVRCAVSAGAIRLRPLVRLRSTAASGTTVEIACSARLPRRSAGRLLRALVTARVGAESRERFIRRRIA
jgi:hypothetical protein